MVCRNSSKQYCRLRRLLNGFDEGPPPREYRDRVRHDRDHEREESALPRSVAPAPVAAPRSVSYAPPRAPSDPFFDKPYEPSASGAEAAWESKAPASPRGMSPNIKPKKRVAALFGAKLPEREPELAHEPEAVAS